MEQTEGRPKQRQLDRADNIFEALCRFALVAAALSSWRVLLTVVSSWRDWRRDILSTRRVSSRRWSVDSTLTRPTQRRHYCS